MLKAKNLSPRQLSFFTALVLSVPIGCGFLLLGHSWKEGLISFLLILGGAYLLILFIFQQFIYRKIKLIYKFIYSTKASRQQETHYKYILPQKSIDEVRADVEAWGEQQQVEIRLLQQNESFRKEFLQNLSHEFKTPVFAMQGFIETLLENPQIDPVTRQDFLQKAERNVQRLSNLIEDLDQISKMESGELNLNKQNFVIQDLVKEVFESISMKAQKHHIELGIKKGCENSLSVYADRNRIRQVLVNLVDNSVKYGKEKGTVSASMYKTDEENILIEISDDGIGISEQNLKRVFERFYRTPEGRNRDIKGSGLGLAICKHIIEAHGHTIHVRSTANVGTTIGFTLDAVKN
jgi:two-component system, OmpR family, phosphate regulon sensor histidine kinase PhoR